MLNNITLRYRRVQSAFSSGTISLVEEGDSYEAEEPLKTFECVDWYTMLRLFAEQLLEHPTAGGVITRTDRAGLVPFVLDAKTVDLLRSDPTAAIKAMTYEVQTVEVSMVNLKKMPAVTTPRVYTGHTLLAASFGDQVYVRRVRQSVECPVCGCLSPYEEGAAFICRKNCRTFELRYVVTTGEWVSFATDDLLDLSHADRFYLPREWNPHGQWITREQLQQLFNDWKNDKETLS